MQSQHSGSNRQARSNSLQSQSLSSATNIADDGHRPTHFISDLLDGHRPIHFIHGHRPRPHARGKRHKSEFSTNSLSDFEVFWNSDFHTVFNTAGLSNIHHVVFWISDFHKVQVQGLRLKV